MASELNELIVAPELEKLPCMQRDKAKLQELVSIIIADHDSPRHEVRDYSHSAITVTKTRVVAEKYDYANSRMSVKIQLEGCSEKWLIDIYRPKEARDDIKGFAQAIKQAAARLHEKYKRGEDAPAVIPEDAGASALEATEKEVLEMSISKKVAGRRKTSDVLNEDVVLELLECCLERGGSLRTVDNAFLTEEIRKRGIDCNPLLAVKYLEKRGLISIKPVPRRPQLIVTAAGYSMVLAFQQRLLQEQKEAEKLELQQEVLKFATKAQPLLREIKSIIILREMSAAVQGREKEQAKHIEKLRIELLAEEKKLEDLKTEKQKYLNRISEQVSGLNEKKLQQLLELAEKASSIS